MSKIVVFAGSPRQKDGQTWALLAQLVKGAESNNASVVTYNLNDPGLRGCQGCFYCRKHPTCSVDDMLKPAYEDIAAADALVVTSPIYFADVSGQAKIWLDRMFPMLDGTSFAPRNPGKRVATIFSQGDGDAGRFEPAIKRFHRFLQVFGWKIEDSLVCAGVSSPDFVLSEQLKEQALQLGRRLAQ